jgi:hypothetical protein
MREVLSLATFVLGVLCFVAFVTAVKPNAFAAAEAPNKPAHCQTDDSQRRGLAIPAGNVVGLQPPGIPLRGRPRA